MENKPVILVVEDDKSIRNFICVSLNANGYKYIETDSGKNAISLAASHRPDIIILDLGLPDIDGIDVITELRKLTKAPIVVVSARGQEKEKVLALDSGADDYLTKPFSLPELLARLRVALRHLIPTSTSNQQELSSLFTVGELKIDYEKRHVYLSSDEVHLTPLEYKLLVLMAKQAGKVLTHKFILREIWGDTNGSDTLSLRVFMANMRRKIEKEPAQPRYLLTEVGVGYRLADE
jgi:two-component system, OmpR family, KDP operon response regulator KdpE